MGKEMSGMPDAMAGGMHKVGKEMSGMPDVQACGMHKGEKRFQACRMCRRAACIKGKRDVRHAGCAGVRHA